MTGEAEAVVNKPFSPSAVPASAGAYLIGVWTVFAL